MTLSSASKLSFAFIIILMLLSVPTVSAAPLMDIDYPFNADTEQPVHIFVNITSDLPISEVILTYVNPSNDKYFEEMNQTSGNETDGTWHYEIPAQKYKGKLKIGIYASDITGDSTPVPPPTLTINLEGPEPKTPFPWNIVVIVIFLAVAFIATELVFKPGFYRLTGRQRAEALEEEDRKKKEDSENRD